MSKKQREFNKSELALLEVAKKMPPLKNSEYPEVFDINKSEVALWLSKQPEGKLVLLNLVGRRKQDVVIALNHETGKWQGVDYER